MRLVGADDDAPVSLGAFWREPMAVVGVARMNRRKLRRIRPRAWIPTQSKFHAERHRDPDSWHSPGIALRQQPEPFRRAASRTHLNRASALGERVFSGLSSCDDPTGATSASHCAHARHHARKRREFCQAVLYSLYFLPIITGAAVRPHGNACCSCPLRESGAGEALVDRFVDFVRSVDIGEMPKILHDDKAGAGYGFSDMRRAYHGNKIIVGSQYSKRLKWRNQT